MDTNRIERHLREGPPNEPAYAGRRFTAPTEAPSMLVARPAVRAAVPSLAAALLVVIGAVLVVLLRAGQPGPLPGGVIATPSPTPSATPSPVPTVAASDCLANVHLAVTSVEGAAGSRIFNFSVTNSGANACTISIKRAEILDSGSTTTTLVSADIRPAHPLALRAGAKATGMTRWSNECTAVRGRLELKLVLTSNNSLVAGVPEDTVFATPPCNGPGGASLEIRFGS